MPNYAYLKADIQSTAENEGTEFEDQIPKFVAKSEYRLIKDLDDVGLNEYVTVALAAGVGTITLTATTLGNRTRIVRNVNYKASSSSGVTNLLQRTTEYANDYWPVSASTGNPRYYTQKDNTSLKIVPTPVSAITTEIKAECLPMPLASATGTSATTTNYFSEHCYNALFYGCMIEATMFMKDWGTLPVWQGEYNNSIKMLQNQARRTRQDDMEVAASPAGGPDTILQGGS